MKFHLGEMFCGPGGLALGASLAKSTISGEIWEAIPTWANDIDPDACSTYSENIYKRLHGFRSKKADNCPVQALKIKSLEKIDAFAFGFPCNDYSIVGEQKGMAGSYGPLYSYGIQAIHHFKPKWFVAENVSGLANANGGDAFRKILRELEAAGRGYELTTHLYKFEEYGVAQRRHRIIVVGIEKRLGLKFNVPKPTTAKNQLSAMAAITNPPILMNAHNNEPTKQSRIVIERLKHIPEGANAWHASLPKRLQLNVKGARLSQIYKRLEASKPSYTITGSGGGGTHVYHWSEPRALTNRERARLQSFPDDYIFSGSKEKVRKQIGMAVPPQGAAVIVRAIFNTFARKPYQSVEPRWTGSEMTVAR